MKIERFEQFRDERARYALLHTCEDCAYFVREEGACAHGYPNARHRLAAFEAPSGDGTFCKEFEPA